MLKTKLSKAEHEALEESLKSLYVDDGEGFRLDADYEDVTGLKAKRDELLGKVQELTKAMKSFEGLDPEKAREALEKISKADDDDLLNKRKYDELVQKKTAEWDGKEKGYQEKIASLISRAAEKDLAMKLIANGVKETVAGDLALILKTNHIKAVEDGDDIIWKSLDGLETIELDKYIPGLKDNGKADYFKSTLGGGSGASGSQGQPGAVDISKMTAEQKIEYGLQNRK